jgi:large subunit ribosomal protein L10
MPNPQKINTVAEIKKLFDAAGSIFITDYQGLSVTEITDLRKNLRENQVTYRVAKNTLLKLAAHQAGVGDMIGEHLTGPTAVAFTSEDAAIAAKILHDSYKDRELPRMKVFVVDGQVFDGREIKRLADLPPREILLAQVIAAVEAPISELVGTLDGFFRELVGSIEAVAEKKKSEE